MEKIIVKKTEFLNIRVTKRFKRLVQEEAEEMGIPFLILARNLLEHSFDLHLKGKVRRGRKKTV